MVQTLVLWKDGPSNSNRLTTCCERPQERLCQSIQHIHNTISISDVLLLRAGFDCLQLVGDKYPRDGSDTKRGSLDMPRKGRQGRLQYVVAGVTDAPWLRC